MIYTYDRFTNLPQIQLIPSHRIGQRESGNTVLAGKYEGFNIYDGVIVNKLNRPIAYRILGNTADEDKDLPANFVQFLYRRNGATSSAVLVASPDRSLTCSTFRIQTS